tara:strand:+ start:604 stop:792 length:189 start_codon:yes stop_codon:yes gene_type:complete
MDEKMIGDMMACFYSLERKDLVEYLQFMIEAIQHDDSVEWTDEDIDEELEVIEDDNGFLSLV